MDEQGLPCSVRLRRFGKRRMKREEAVEFRPVCEILCKVPAQAGKGRIAGRSDDVQAVGGAPLDDEDEASLNIGSCERHLWKRKCRESARSAACGDE
jgi:hypothetical protein